MKTFSKILCILFSIAILLSACIFTTSAANSAIIAFSDNTIGVGENVTVTVTINPDVEMYAVGFYLQYNDSVLRYEGGSGVGDAGVLQVVESPSGQKSVRYSFNFSSLKTGASNVSVSDCVYDILADGAAQTVEFGGASAKITVEDTKLSDNNKLNSLKVSGYSISPKFSKTTYNYTLKVPNKTKKINISAQTDDAKAKVVSVSGNSNLKVGKNTVTVEVEAENGSSQKYTIVVTREKEEVSSEASKQESSKEESSQEQSSQVSSEATSSKEESSKQENSSKQEEVSSEETSSEETTDDKSLITTISGTEYTIITKIPEDVLLKGFEIKTEKINGYDVEIAVDSDNNFRLFYLKAVNDDTLVPYIYDETLDQFEKLKYIAIDGKDIIFCDLPEKLNLTDNLYVSKAKISGITVECISDTNSDMSDFHYVYCYVDGDFGFYRYDSLEQNLQRFPDLDNIPTIGTADEKEPSRFASLSTGGKVVVIALAVLIIGIFALLIMLIVHLFKKSLNNTDGVVLSAVYEDFDEIDNDDNNVLK